MSHDNPRKTIVVLGAGVSGLTAAHELVKRGFQVEVYERNAEPGGIARSVTEPDGTPQHPDCPGAVPRRTRGGARRKD